VTATLALVRSVPGTVLLALTVALAVAGPAAGEGGQYEAKYISESGFPTLESGETVTSYFVAQNVGTATWTNDIVRLGTSNPRDRTSAFANSSWVYPWRPTVLDNAFVKPGETGRFTFTMTAPAVSSTTVYDEYFAPVADGVAWMENNAENWPPNGVWLRYTVVPPAAPKVAIASAPGRVRQNTPVTVRATASDNRKVSRVEFRLGTKAAVVDRSSPYEVTLDSSGLAEGPQPITATAVDGAGRTARATASVFLDPTPNGANASRSVKMTAGFGKKRPRPRVTIRYGKATYVRGKLKTASGLPIGGAIVRVATRVLTGDRGFRELPPVSTGSDGGFAYRAPRGPSRQIRLTYTPFAEDTQPAAAKLVRLKTHAAVTLTANRRRVSPGGRLVLRGRLKGGHRPRRGVLISLQGYQRGYGWRTFKTVRERKGRFSTGYRVLRAPRGTRLRFRATVREQATYPWASGRSRPVGVSVR
jgi:Bacterial Ig domain